MDENRLLQRATDNTMRGKAGSLVVLDVKTGKILASHDLESAATQLVQPGSTLKPFIILAMLNSGKLSSGEELVCRRKLRIGSVEMDCTHPESIRLLDAESAIAYSCNSYVAQIAARLSGAELSDILRRAGLDGRTGLAANEATGRIDTPATTDDVQLEALGEEGIEVTPLELLSAYRQLALRQSNSAGKNYEVVLRGLTDSVEFGMAHPAHVNGLSIAGKTGTARSRGSAQTHGLFVGFAPADKPEIALVVLIPRGRGADAAAAAQPVFAAFAKNAEKK